MALCSHGQYEDDPGYPEQNTPDYVRWEKIYIKYFNTHGAKHYNLEGSIPVQVMLVCAGQSDTGPGFLRVLRFPLPIFITQTAPHSSSSSIIRGWYNRPNSGRCIRWTESHSTSRNQKKRTVTPTSTTLTRGQKQVLN
jgi:hypothetical protein